MFMKKRVIWLFLCLVTALAALYFGVSCAATWCRAAAQPCLISGTLRFGFLGYYMMAAADGFLCTVFLLVFICIYKAYQKRQRH